MATQVFAVPVVPQDMRTAEAYVQACDALQELGRVSEALFARVAERVAAEQSRLAGVSARVQRASSGVAALRSSYATRATRVHSPAKFPAPAEPPYVPLHVAAVSAARARPRHPSARLEGGGGAAAATAGRARDTAFHNDLLAHFEAAHAAAQARADQPLQVEGLGRLPQHMPAVPSLLLFNTSENPYKKYISLDNLAGGTGGAERPPSPRRRLLGAAPKTVAEGEAAMGLEAERIDYRPQMGELPAMNLPSALPLPMLAADLAWAADALPSIAPSLPPVPASAPAAAVPTSAGSAAAAPPPPPPANSAAPPPPPPASSSVPPPPPPPPSAPDVAGPPPPEPPQRAEEHPEEMGEQPAAEDGRGGLLEEIRRGKALKKTPADDGDMAAGSSRGRGKQKDNSGSGGGTGDIFSDLIMALNRRRNNLGGKQDANAPKPSARRKAADDAPPAPALDSDAPAPPADAMPPPPPPTEEKEEWDE